MKTKGKILLVFVLLAASYIVARPFVRVTVSDAGVYLSARPSIAERFASVAHWGR